MWRAEFATTQRPREMKCKLLRRIRSVPVSSVVADAADAYMQIRGYQARIAIAKNQIETDEQLLKLVRTARCRRCDET